MDPRDALTGMTSLPIPSAGIKPILSVFLTVVTREREAMSRQWRSIEKEKDARGDAKRYGNVTLFI